MSSESVVQQRVRLNFADIGPLWRNNSGAYFDERGRMVRYGLGNDSAALNEEIKSSDLIGVTPEWGYIERFGWRWIGVFTALEVKPTGWHQTPGDKRAGAQAKFHDIVRQSGGFAGFVTDPADIAKVIGR